MATNFFADLVDGCRLAQAARGGALKTQVGLLENASMEKASMKQRISQGWKTQVRKMQVQCKPSVR